MLSARKRLLLAKLETTYGVDPVPTGVNALVVSALDVSPMEAETAERTLIRPYFGQGERLMTQIYSKVTFEIELAAHTGGVAGDIPKIDALLQAAGFAGAVVSSTYKYSPITDAIHSVAFYYSVDGVLHKVLGCRGTFSIDIQVKSIPKLKFEFTGLNTSPVDAAAATPDFSGFSIPQVVNTQNTTAYSLLGYAGALASLNIAMNNTIIYRTLVGLEYVGMFNRLASGSMSFEAPTIAQKDYWAAAKNQTTGALSITHGSVSGNKVKIDAPRVMLDSPKYSESDDVMMLNCGVSIMPTTGNDDITITFE